MRGAISWIQVASVTSYSNYHRRTAQLHRPASKLIGEAPTVGWAWR
jgi:hypothetical protein